VRLVQGSHVVVPRLFDDPRAYLFQNADGRIVFAIPYEEDFTLIGTTDLDYRGDPAGVAITPEETAYLCAAASAYFATPVRPAEVVWSYSGVRPLLDDGASKAQEATRDYVLRCEDGEAPLLTVLGGKITTYRRLAEAALGEIEARLGRRGPAWTARAPLPGGDFEAEAFDALVAALARAHPRLAPADARRLVRLYGTKAAAMLGRDPGRSLGAGLTEAELRHLVDEEWARTDEDVLWRRTKLGLRVSAAEARALAAFMGETGALREVAG
jgi:glycerol-3-phosphate dehydrogenase